MPIARRAAALEGIAAGVDCTQAPVGKQKARERFAAGANKKPVTYLVMPGQVEEVKGVCDPRPGKNRYVTQILPKESHGINMYVGSQTIWRDHCRHDAKRRVRDCRQLRPIPELPYLLEQSRQIAPATFPGWS